MFFCFIYTSLSYYLSAQLMTWTRFLMFLFVCQLMTLISEGIGLILGTAMNPVVSCYKLTWLKLITVLITQQFYFRTESLSVRSLHVCVFSLPVSWCFSITCLSPCTMCHTSVTWGTLSKGWLYPFMVMAVNHSNVSTKKAIVIIVSRKLHLKK